MVYRALCIIKVPLALKHQQWTGANLWVGMTTCVCAQYLGVSGDDGDTSGSGLFPKNEAMTHLGRDLGTGETAIRPGGEGEDRISHAIYTYGELDMPHTTTAHVL